jgi:hypothetical protein
MKTIINSANKKSEHSPDSPDEKKVAEYVFSNFSPLIGHAVRKLKAKGHLPSNAQEEDHHEAGINGLMHAVDKYDPAVGDFKPYALRTIMGHILTANKPKQMSQSDYQRIKGFKQDSSQAPGQQVVQPSSSRRVTEDLGQSFSDSGGESQSAGLSIEKDPSIAAAGIVQNVPEARKWVEGKVEQAAKRLNPDLLPDDVRKRLEAIKQAKAGQPQAPVQPVTPAEQQDKQPEVPSQHGEVKTVTDPEALARMQAEYEKKYKK